MLHFCSAADVATLFAAANRYGEAIENARKATTDDFNRYMRRRMDWEEGVEEIVSPPASGTNIWLSKKAIDPDSLVIATSRTSVFATDDDSIPREGYNLTADKGKLQIFDLSSGVRTLRLRYNAGWKALGTSDVMDCPANVKLAAINQTVFTLRRDIGLNQGQSADETKKGQIKRDVLVDGILADAARTLNPYRRTLGM